MIQTAPGSASKNGKRAQSRKISPSRVAAASATPGRSSFLGTNGRSLGRYAGEASQSTLLELAGGLEEGKMVMRGTLPSRQQPGKTVLHRVTWTPLEGGRLRQLWEASRDDGKTWAVQFDGVYSRKG